MVKNQYLCIQLMLAESRNIFFYPRQVFVDRWVSGVVLAICHYVTSHSVHSPRSIVVVAHHGTTTITPACIGVGGFSKSHADSLLLMSAFSFFHNGHARLLEKVGWTSRMLSASPTWCERGKRMKSIWTFGFLLKFASEYLLNRTPVWTPDMYRIL